MTESKQSDNAERRREGQPWRVRLPGFLAEEEIGLGDVISKAAGYAGFRPCGDCARRAATLNRRFVFSGRRSG
jgi:hypothetical protein